MGERQLYGKTMMMTKHLKRPKNPSAVDFEKESTKNKRLSALLGSEYHVGTT